MEVEFTARQGKVTKAIRDQATEKLEKLSKILGKTTRASIILGAERHLQKVEITLQARSQSIVATGKAEKTEAALRQALEHAENQVMRNRDRKIVAKRLPKEEKVLTAPPVSRNKTRAAQPEEAPAKPSKRKASTSIAVHSFPITKTTVEPHIIHGGDSVSLKPLRIEEAVKEAEFRDRDLLIFRTPAGALHVLHRRRDGQMELVEVD